jgi:hypothetical protein
MGLVARLRLIARTLTGRRSQTFAAPPYDPIDRLITTMRRSGWNLSYSRETALQVPAVLRGRNLICAISTLPLVQVRPDNTTERSTLLAQIDDQVPNVVTLAMTVEDLLFEGIAWWRVTARGWNGFPAKARHVEHGRVSLKPPDGPRGENILPSGEDPSGTVWVDGEPVPGRDMIRFDSPNPPLLVAARRAISRAIRLELTAEMYAANPRPLDYFTPAPDADDPADDDEIAEILADWLSAREEGSTAYIPQSLEYHTVDTISPADLQLVELQARAALDLANAIGLDPEDLGVSTTSRTYQNATDRRQDRLNDVLAPYLRAVTDRLSMNDVTRQGYRTRWDLSDYLKADPLTRASWAQTMVTLKAITSDEIREREEYPPLTPAQRRQLNPPAPAPAAPAPTTTQQGAPVPTQQQQQHAPAPAQTFAGAGPTRLRFPDGGTTGFRADTARRTVSGLLIPFGPVGTNDEGRWRFAPGSVEWNRAAVSRQKLNRDHSPGQLLGSATDVREVSAGIDATYRLARGPEQDQALSLAEDGALDGLSAEVDITDYVIDPTDPTVFLVTRARLTGAALTATPAFDDARLTSVAASQGGTMRCQLCGHDHPQGTPCPTAAPAPAAPATAQLGAPAPAPAVPTPAPAPTVPTGAVPVPAGGVQFSAEQLAAIGQAMAAALAEQGPATVNPTRPLPGLGTTFLQRDPAPYRFDRGGNFVQRSPEDHLFSRDLRDAIRAHDLRGESTEPGKRVMDFMRRMFATVTTDVNELNPAVNRPDMYVDQVDYRYPLWNMVNKGTLPYGLTPFLFPKFSTAASLTGAHTEGTEPSAGSFTTTSQTVTPTATSGKASVTREVWEMGGNPQTSGLILRQMRRSWWEGIEAAVSTFLATLTAATDITLTTAAADDDLAGEWDAALAALQFTRGYDFSAFAVEQYLYLQLVAAVDGNGRKLFPILNPQNANGTSSSRFRSLDLSGVTGVPAWALAATDGASNISYLFDPEYVYGWATTPQELSFAGTAADGSYAPIAMVDVGIWGFTAFANTDIAAVREVKYDNAA